MARSTSNKRTPAPAPVTAPEPTDSTDEPTADSTAPEPTPADEPTPEPDSDSDTADEPGTDSPEPTPDVLDTLGAAWRAAVDSADDSTGTVPAVTADALGTAYRAVSPAKRGPAVAALVSADSTAALAPVHAGTGGPDTGLMIRSGGVAALVSTFGTAPAAPVVTDTDKRHALAGAMLALMLPSGTDEPGHGWPVGTLDTLAGVLGTDTADALALAGWIGSEPTDGDPSGIVRARAALSGASGKRAGGRSGGSGGSGKRSTPADAPTDEHGKPLPVAARVARALSARTDEHPDGMTDTALSGVAGAGGGAIAAVSAKAADEHGIMRVKVNGANGWALVSA